MAKTGQRQKKCNWFDGKEGATGVTEVCNGEKGEKALLGLKAERSLVVRPRLGLGRNYWIVICADLIPDSAGDTTG